MTSTMKTGRKPAAGLLLPLQTTKITIELPLKETEAPVVICRHVGDVTIDEVKPNSFRLTNTTAKVAPYFAFVVPKMLVQLTSMPWKDALGLVKFAYQSGMLNDRIKDFFNSFKPNL